MTIRTWLYRRGMQGKKLYERFIAELELVHVQLGELWANVKDDSQDMWLWIAGTANTVANYIHVENYLAMLKAAADFNGKAA